MTSRLVRLGQTRDPSFQNGLLRSAAMASWKEGALSALGKREKAAPAVLVIAALVVGGVVYRAYPREVRLRYALGPDHAEVHDLWLSYEQDGEEVRGVRFHYEDGAPAHVYHAVDLAEGRYTIKAELRGPNLARDVTRALVAPAQGRVRVRLYDAPEAMAARSRAVHDRAPHATQREPSWTGSGVRL